MSYTKLFSHIITSSVWSEDDQTRILWITMLALADKHGEVMAAIPGLAKVASLSVDATRRGIERLMAPDFDSRTPDMEGRRIMKIEGGWHIINHAKHRRMASVDEEKQKNAERQRRWYARHKKHQPNENLTKTDAPITPCNGPITPRIDNAEAEAEAEVQKSTKQIKEGTDLFHPESAKEGTGNHSLGRPRGVRDESKFIEFWNMLPKVLRIGPGKTKEAWNKKVNNGATADEIIAGVPKYLKYEKARRQQDENGYRPLHPTTWLNQERWNDGEEMESDES